MIVDFQHHFLPRELLPEGAGDTPFTRYDEHGVPSYSFHNLLVDLDAHIEMMDAAGIGGGGALLRGGDVFEPGEVRPLQ